MSKILSGYFDYAGATPVDERVTKAMSPYFTDFFYNPSAQYEQARSVAKHVKDARASVAKILGTKPSEILFTAGGTESNNLAIQGVMKQYPDCNIVVSTIEHDSVLEPTTSNTHKLCPVDEKGLIKLNDLLSLIDDKTVLVSVMLANNEIGTIQPIKKVAEIIKAINQSRQKKDIKTPLYLHSDCAQATNYLDLNIDRLGVDLLSINGGKIYGPKQSGILFVKNSVQLKPVIMGGGQERGLRSGTENVPAIIGFTKALELTSKLRKTETKRLNDLQKFFIELLEKNLATYQINGSLKNRLPNNVHLTFFEQDNERMMMKLDELGFQVAVGSACSASSDEPSHVLKALGMSKKDIQASLRFTMGRQTTEENIRSLVSAVKSSIRA